MYKRQREGLELGASALEHLKAQAWPGNIRELRHTIERAMIVKSLRHHAGNLTRVAESLGMSRPALYRRIEKHGITV